MNRLIAALEALDINVIKIQYNDFDDGFNETGSSQEPRSVLVSSRLQISGMTCVACVGTIQKAVSELEGVEQVSVSLPLERATVVYDRSKTSSEYFVARIKDCGYEAKVGERTMQQSLELLQHKQELEDLRRSFNGGVALSSAISVCEQIRARALPVTGESQADEFLHLCSMLLAFWVQVYYASWIHRNAWNKGRKGTFTMDTLISLSLLLGLCLSMFNVMLRGLRGGQTYFVSGSFLTTVITAGRLLDVLLKKRSAANFTSLFRLQSEAASVKVRKNGGYVPAALLRVQEEIVLEPYRIIPCDCYVLEGSSTVDESMMTGEPVPVPKSAGDNLISGTRNLSEPLVAVVYKEQQDSSLEQLIESITYCTEQKTGGQDRVESMTTYFVSVVLCLTAVGFCWTLWHTSPGLAMVERINIACERAMAILAASCPCAIGLAIPSATMAGIDAAWCHGMLLVGGARTIEDVSHLTHIVMDKTGTLTEGRFEVANWAFSSRWIGAKDVCCRLLCAAERPESQAHPVGKAVFQWALTQLQSVDKRIQSINLTRSYTNVPGRGLSCEVEDSGIWYSLHIGTQVFLQQNGINVTSDDIARPPLGTTEVHFAIGGEYAGIIVLQDTIRTEAPSVISKLRQSGLNVTMLTGDTPSEAFRVSNQLDMEILASCSLPHEKSALVSKLQSHGHNVAMVGDGINDALAQSTANVGILLALSRTCMTGAADVIIMSPDLKCLCSLLEISRKTMACAKWSVRWAVTYNFVAIGLAIGLGERWGISIDAALAGTMMAFSSASVVGISLLLRRQLSK